MSLFPMQVSQAHTRLVQAGVALLTAALIAGCGAGYRPVVTPINPSGPPAQVTSLAAVVSAPSPTTAGIATIIDYSGDTIVAQAPIGPGPITFSVDETGSTGYTVNSDGTLTNFPVSSSLQAKNVTFTTLPTAAQPVSLFSPSTGLWLTDLNGNLADVLTGSPATFKLSVPVAATPVMIIGPGVVGERNYAITQGAVASGTACNTSPATGPTGAEADAIEIASDTVSARIPLGICPVYAVQSPDGRRLFVMNRGGDSVNPNGSITVINSQNNTPDTCTPFQNQNGKWITCHPSIALPAGPVYAEYIPSTQQLVVANYDSNSISIIDVPEDEFGNDANTYTNNNCTTYADCGAITGGFGTVYNVTVGANPASVTALADGSRAYTANQADGTVTVVSLTSHIAEKTLPVNGHPRTVTSTQNSLFGKVFVASPDSPYLTILRTDQDIVDTTVLVQGNILDVRVSTQNGTAGNSNVTSRKPGFGQPCYLPGATAAASYTTCTTLP
jgi:hypothetical protein